MGTLSGVLPVPGFGSKVAAKSRVDYQSTPEGGLVSRAQAGDEAAFREIVERYQSKVFSIIHGIVRQRNDVEDIAQQVFAKVYLSIKSFDFRSSLITWIYKITVNECFDYLRKRKVRKLVYESDLSEDEVQRLVTSKEHVLSSQQEENAHKEIEEEPRMLANVRVVTHLRGRRVGRAGAAASSENKGRPATPRTTLPARPAKRT